MNIAPLKGEYKEVICLKTISINHIYWGTIEVFERQSYRECLSGFGFLKKNSKDDCALIEIDGNLWPFDKKHFGTLRDLREKKLKELDI